jgi:aminocarboxymuconate-semialdehyde decarboxylase
MKIDTHCHLSSEGLAKTISKNTPYKFGIDRKNRILSTALAETMPLLNEDERIEEMDEMGVDVNVLSVGTYILFSEQQLNESVEIRLKISQVVNDYLASVCQRHPQRLMAFADVPLTLGDKGIKEMMRSLDELHLHGIGLVTSFDGKYLDAPEFQPFFEEANRRKLVAFVHPFNPPGTRQALMELEMYRVVGFPCETTLTFCRMAYSGFIAKYPDLTFILPHVGGTIPFLWPRIDYTYNGNLPHPPTYYLKRYYYDTALSDTKSLMLAYQRVGDHLVFGTDYPFKKEHISRTLASINGMPVSEELKDQILGGNALSLFSDRANALLKSA